MHNENSQSDFIIQPLENDLVKLIPLPGFDFEMIYNVASDPLIWAQHPASDRYKRDKFENYFMNAPASQSAFVIVDKLTDEIIGSTRFYDFNLSRKSVAIGYTFLAKKYWGGRFNKTIKTTLLDYAFQSVDTVYFHIAPTNLRSQKATLKIGTIKGGEFALDFNGQKLVHQEYSICKKDWIVMER